MLVGLEEDELTWLFACSSPARKSFLKNPTHEVINLLDLGFLVVFCVQKIKAVMFLLVVDLYYVAACRLSYHQ